MSLVRYNPFWDVQNLRQNLDRIWDNGNETFSAIKEATMDLYEQDGKLVAEVSLPNFKKDEIDVTTNEGFLEITAKHSQEKEEKGRRYYYFQESADRYFRRIELPEGAQADKIQASFEDGILQVSMPMVVQHDAKKVLVQ